MSTGARPVIHIRFRRIERLGSGRSGTVFLVEEKSTKRLFALKTLRAGYSEQDLSRIKQEFAVLSRLSYPFLSDVVEVGEDEEEGFYVLREFVPGKPLRAGPTPPDAEPQDHLRPVLDVLAALVFLHGNGIFHLDIHPGNVIERPDGHGVLIDAGLLPPDGKHGTPPDGKGRTTPKHNPAACDLHSAAILLKWRLAGRNPPAAPLPVTGDWPETLSVHLERILERALSSRDEPGYEEAIDLLSDLCNVLGVPADEFLVPGESRVFVGRRRALETAEAFLRTLKSGKGRGLWIYGKPGMGRSRFLSELRARAEALGIVTESFRVFPEETFSPQVFEKILLGKKRSGAAPSGLDPDFEARRFIDNLASFFERPTLVTIDDFQNADPQGRAFLESLLRGLVSEPSPPLGISVADVSPPPFRSVTSLRLSGLSRKESERLLNQLFFPKNSAPQELRSVSSLARGSPKLLHRYARALRGRRLRGGAGKTDGARLSELLWEDAAEAGPSARRLLSFLSLFGRPVSLSELERATGLKSSAPPPI